MNKLKICQKESHIVNYIILSNACIRVDRF
jgi:hypothetical protein